MDMTGRKLALSVSKEAANAGMNVFYILDKAHIDKSTFYRWRRGDGYPNQESLKKLEQCLENINKVETVFHTQTGVRHAS
jgi:ribosome-binding protein aMBF1 (putative translation factor)